VSVTFSCYNHGHYLNDAVQTWDTRFPVIWAARRALDEKTTDLIYQTTLFVCILPNFLFWYVYDEFIQHLMKIWNIQLPQKLKSSAL